jgi:hypothetical protein
MRVDYTLRTHHVALVPLTTWDRNGIRFDRYIAEKVTGYAYD